MQQLHNFKYTSSAASLMYFFSRFFFLGWAHSALYKVFKVYKGYPGGVSFHLILVYHLKLATFQFLASVGCAYCKNTITSLLVIDHVFLTMKTKLPFHLCRYNSSTNLAFRHFSEEVLAVSFK